MARFAIDVTACWRPQRVGMLTVAVELTKALVAARGEDEYTLLCSRERPAELAGLDCEAVLSPYRHELALKTRWLPAVEAQLDCDAILYPYWPSPPLRRRGAPPAAVFVHDLAFKLRPARGALAAAPLHGRGPGPLPAQRGRGARALGVDAARPAGRLSDHRLEVEGLSGAGGRVARTAAGPLPDRLEPGFILAVGHDRAAQELPAPARGVPAAEARVGAAARRRPAGSAASS